MNQQQLHKAIGNTDIYVIDQILKQRSLAGQHILDAGCARGRNLNWFYQNSFDISGIDIDSKFIAEAKELYPNSVSAFQIGNLDALPYADARFDHILCCAVLHFAEDENQFTAMFSELIRVLKPEGSLLIRMASDIGLDGNAPIIKYQVTGQKGTYYLTRDRISKLLEEFSIELLEPVKSTNVQDERSMTTLLIKKTH